MKVAGFFLTVTGFFLTLAALILLPGIGMRAIFVVCGFGVECAGLAMVFRSHTVLARVSHR